MEKFKYIGLNIEQKNMEIFIVQQDYTKRILPPDRKSFKIERKLTEKEQTLYRSLIGQLNWLAQHTRPDIAYDVSKFSKKCKQAMATDMRGLVKLIEKTQGEMVKLKIEKLGKDVYLEIFADASFNNVGDGNSQIGYIISLKDREGKKCSIYWKSRVAKRVSKSTLEAEALGLGEAVDTGIYLRRLWKDVTGEHIPIKVRTDCKSLESALQSKSGVLNKRLRIDIASIKEIIEREDIAEILWVPSQKQVADILTKEGVQNKQILEYIQ